MTSNPIRRMVAVAGLLVVAATVLAPTALAQQPTFDMQVTAKPGKPLQPISEPFNLNIHWTYTLTLAPQNLAGPLGTATITIDVKCPQDKILLAGSETALVPLQPQTATQNSKYEGDVSLTLTVLREAQGLVPIQCDVEGGAGAVGGNSPTVPASNPKTDSFTVIPQYFSLLEASAASKLKQGGPQKQIPFAIDLTNFGNAGTKVSFSIEEAPSGGWQGLIPDPILLDPPGGNQQSKQVTFNVATPYKNGWNNKEGAFTVKMTPEYQFKTDDGQIGSPVTLTVLARVRGVYVPSLEPMVLVGAILGCALVLRLQRAE